MARGGPREGAGRPRNPAPKLTRSLRERVAIAAAFGMPHVEIATGLGISLATLQSKYSRELSQGAYRCRIEILVAMHATALAGSVPAMRAFLRHSPRFTLAPVPMGKKEAAQRSAENAQEGTAWADLLPASPTKQ